MASVLSLHRQIAKSRRQAAERASRQPMRWHPEHNIAHLAMPEGPYLTEAARQRAIRREARAMASAVKHGRSPSDIASHIARNAGIAHRQPAREA